MGVASGAVWSLQSTAGWVRGSWQVMLLLQQPGIACPFECIYDPTLIMAATRPHQAKQAKSLVAAARSVHPPCRWYGEVHGQLAG